MAQHQLHVRQTWTILRDRLSSLLGSTHRGARNLYENFGWERNLIVEQLFAMYYRGGLGNRICKLYPAATWRDTPLIKDEAGDSADETSEDFSPFVKGVEDFFKKHKVYSYLERVDRVSSVGRYALLLMGFRDGLPLDQPLAEGNYPLLYLSVYADPNITISEWEINHQSPRFGKPNFYTVNTGNPVVGGGLQTATHIRSLRVHHSRVLHLAEYVDEDEVFGLPRLVPVYNTLQDLEKLLGAGAETYWFNSRGGMVWSADKDANFTDADIVRMEKQAEEFANQLRRITALQGVTPTMLASTMNDPGPLIDKMLDVIAGAVSIPKRILIGSERGELSSDQDENNWAQRIEERRENYASPYILQPVVSKLLMTGNIPMPEGQWEVQWLGEGLGPQKAAEVGQLRSNTLRNYVTSPGANLVVPEEEFRKEFLGLEPVSEYDIDLEEPEALPEDVLLEEPVPPPEGPDLFGNPADQKEFVKVFAASVGTNHQPIGLTQLQLSAFKASDFGQEFLKTHSLVRTLYVRRPVLNANDIAVWAKDQGFTTILGPDVLHVTIAYSTQPVDWFAIPESATTSSNVDGTLLVKPGGARAVKEYDGGAIVLCFKSDALEYRHQQICDVGASYRFGTMYQPHITLTYNRDDLDLDDVIPYVGRLELGPEIFEEVSNGGGEDVEMVI